MFGFKALFLSILLFVSGIAAIVIFSPAADDPSFVVYNRVADQGITAGFITAIIWFVSLIVYKPYRYLKSWADGDLSNTEHPSVSVTSAVSPPVIIPLKPIEKAITYKSCGKYMGESDVKNAQNDSGDCRDCTSQSRLNTATNPHHNLSTIKEPDEQEKSLAQYIQRAEQGDLVSQYELGWKYRNGAGVSPNFNEAIKWWSQSAEQFDIPSITSLGYLYRHGDYVKTNVSFEFIDVDYNEAFRWYKFGACLGDNYSQNILGEMYRIGEGRLQDSILAHMWYNIAAANSNEEGRINRDALAGKMTSADISKAQEMARECMSSNYQNCGE